MKHTVVHDEEEDTVRRAAAEGLLRCKERFPSYHPDAVWSTPDHADIRFRVRGRTLHGTIDLRPRAIDLELEVPLLFRMFRDRAIRAVESEVRKWLASARPGTPP